MSTLHPSQTPVSGSGNADYHKSDMSHTGSPLAAQLAHDLPVATGAGIRLSSSNIAVLNASAVS